MEIIEPLATRSEPFARALLANNLGSVALARGDRATARDKFATAFTAARGVTGAHAIELANIHVNMAIVATDPSARDEHWRLVVHAPEGGVTRHILQISGLGGLVDLL